MNPHLTTSASPATKSFAGSVSQRRQIAQHPGRRVEGPHQILALGGVDSGLAADGRIDHAEQRGRHVHARTPRSQVAATKPARSVVAPPPTPTTASERVKPIRPSTDQQNAATSAVLASSASGISMACAAKPPAARSSRIASPVARRARGWITATV